MPCFQNDEGTFQKVQKKPLLNRQQFQISFCDFRAEKRSAQASAHLLSEAQGGLFCVLTVFDCVCLSVREFWLRLNEMYKVWTFASRKAFLPLCGFCSSSLENYFGLRTTTVKAKTDHSVSLRWNKKFWAFPKRRVLFWLCIRFICELISLSFAGLKNPLVFRLLSKYFFTCPDLFPLQNQLYPSLQQRTICAP